MTELEFKLRNPNIYGGGSMNLLYSSSRDSGSLPLPISQIPVSVLEGYAGTTKNVPSPTIPSSSIDPIQAGIYDDVVEYPIDPLSFRRADRPEYLYTLKDAFFPPYSVIGLTISFSSLNNTVLTDTLNQVKSLTFRIGSDRIKVKVLRISKFSNYFYFQVEPTIFQSMQGTTDSSGTPIDLSVEVSFTDFLSGTFENSDFDVLLGNALTLGTSKGALQVDRNTDSANPSNLFAITTETAAPAEIQYSNYTTTGWTNARYEGSLNTPIQERDMPAQSYMMFEGAIHPLDGNTDTLLALGAGDPDKTKLYFNIESRPTDYIPSGSELLSGSTFPLVKGTPLQTYSDSLIGKGKTRETAFPDTQENLDLDISVSYTATSASYGGSIIYKEEGNKFVRVVSSKIHALDKGSIYTTDEFGIAIIEEVATLDA